MHLSKENKKSISVVNKMMVDFFEKIFSSKSEYGGFNTYYSKSCKAFQLYF